MPLACLPLRGSLLLMIVSPSGLTARAYAMSVVHVRAEDCSIYGVV